MKTIGLIGGLSWESTATYYRYLNEMVQENKGKLHSARCVIHSFDFQEIVLLQQKDKWEEAADKLISAALKLEKAGAECLVICSNTMHRIADDIEEQLSIPLIHIVDVTAAQISAKKLTKVALLGTGYTMEQQFYRERLELNGISVMTPIQQDRHTVHNIIFDELCKGAWKEDSKEKLLKIIDKLKRNGAEGVILGCTELPLLIQQKDVDLPLFDTTLIHAKAAVQLSLSKA
ncbi:aspartate racemase [Salipaludibacillus keqinensis]|uniref:Aspartate racemase n=1 Tax=Salipaludibacillus keqinensis TaxID=2045207 RepID=A0A323T7A4_9BACI|nr:aspartate/glutamate racemase family protein [Salipaludibacillus keqinensis]PYZ91639.1 aspartate racemase [Salipaludibacillus keqinensis]